MPPYCTACGAFAPDSALFCAGCGRSLAGSPSGVDPTSERLVGEIPSAMNTLHGQGPVRIDFTDRRLLALRLGEWSAWPSPRLYRAWKSDTSSWQPWRLVDVRSYAPDRPILWAAENRAILSINATRPIGIGVDRRACELWATVSADGVTASPGGPGAPPLGIDEQGYVRLAWHVHGEPEELLHFLQQTPLGPVASGRHWVRER